MIFTRKPPWRSASLAAFLLTLAIAAAAGRWTSPRWLGEPLPATLQRDAEGRQVAVAGEYRLRVTTGRPGHAFDLAGQSLTGFEAEPPEPRLIYEGGSDEQPRLYYVIAPRRHWGWWSFLPAVTAITLCWITREPLPALFGGILAGGLLIGKENILQDVLVPTLGRPEAATILILYLWLLGGLMGIWARTGATREFAAYVSARFVRGPRSAKFVAWLLGVAFFQGGTISSVLVGTTVRPVTDNERVSHEELSLIVDATSSPIAVLLAFNAWPIYVQALIGVSGVNYLATESDRLAFFFQAVPLSLYAIFAVLFTLLVAVERLPWTPPRLAAARQRARATGQLNAPGAEPLAVDDLARLLPPEAYAAHYLDFLVPLATLLGVAVGTYVWSGTPQVLWAFGAAIAAAICLAAAKGMSLHQIVVALVDGQKSVVLGSVILLLAITVGSMSQETGGGPFLVSLLGQFQWYWLLPAALFAIAVVIAFSTGSSWATFAVTLPLAMPLAHAVGVHHDLDNIWLFHAICFAACLNGGVFGDQCSPISDTTVLSAMCTGADLMDHVKTQMPVAAAAAALALAGWTGLALWCG